MRSVLSLAVVVLSGFASCAADAQTDRGFYVSSEIGVNFAPELGIDADSPNARGSICDEHVNPFRDLMPSSCDDPNAPGTHWSNAFEDAAGILAGAAAGYRLRDGGPLRLELEYFFRETAHNETSPIQGRGGVSAAKLDGEVVLAQDRVGSVTSNNLFGNLYYDFHGRGRVTPYVGIGIGVGFTHMDHGFLWVRNNNPDLITSIASHFPANRQGDLRVVQQNLAGTASSQQTELRDSLFGYQLLLGVDIALTERVSVGAKGRGVVFDSLRDSNEMERLRSHISSNRLDGSDPIRTVVTTDDLAVLGVSFNLKYRF